MTTATRKKDRKSTPVAQREICVLGYAEESRNLVFGLSDNVEIYGINMSHAFTFQKKGEAWVSTTKARATNWFQMHPRSWANTNGEITGYFGRPEEHLEFLQNFNGTVWLQKEDPEIPNGKAYPLVEIVAACGRQHFTSTFAYQMGLIWYQHTRLNQPVKRIYIYGINLSAVDEYIHQKACVEYWLGRLEEAGIDIVVPDASSLLKGKLYAMGKGGDLSDHAFDRLQYWKEQYMTGWANLNTAMSMKSETAYWARTLSAIAEKYPAQFTAEVQADIQAALTQRTASLNKLADKMNADMNGALGMVKDNQHWLSITGGIDHRAPQLPEIRIPSPGMEQDFQMPTAKSI